MWGDKGRFGRALLAVAVLAGGGLAAMGQPAHADGTPPPEAFVLVDAGTGKVLTSRNLHEALPPASTAKIMTALVAVERLPPGATISVSANAAARESMRIGMTPGQKWPFRDAMASLMMVSANDAAYAIAETVGGSIPGFAADLNATARRYGMQDSTFSDPAGLTDTTSYDGGPHVSAYDLAIAARNALTVPAIADWANTRDYQFTDVSGGQHDLTNHDRFLPGATYGYEGANGFKTGYTEIADHTLVATAKRNGRQCIAVILGSVDSGYTWAASLLDQCWANPEPAGTGTVLPPVRVSPYSTRVTQRADFAQLSGAGTAASLLATPTSTPSSSVSSPATQPAASRRTASKKPAHHGGGLFSLGNSVFFLFLALVGGVFLRRRAVRKQRARRIARQRARAKAMRSGSLPVVDGKYRTGTRVGKPVESRVSVQRRFIDLTKEDARQPSHRRSR
jgi:D-alanyl-D-alanine carboxypeptidase (penicillin-binding protein 5/6)